MTWLNPAALWLLLLLPLLFLARRRRARERVMVGNLPLWTSVTARQVPAFSASLRRHRPIVLQCAIMAALAVAVAGPRLSYRSHVAIVVDTSMSMGTRNGEATRLDLARARAADIMSQLPWGARAQVWLAGAEAQALGELHGSVSGLGGALRNVRQGDTGADLGQAVQQARAAEPMPARIYVITDRAPDDLAGADVEWITVGAPAANVALTGLAVRRDRANGSVELLVNAANDGDRETTAAIVVSQDGRVLAQGEIVLPPDGDGSTVLTTPDVSGIVTARLNVADALAGDNVRTTSVESAAPLDVLVIGGRGSIRHALAAYGARVETFTGEDSPAGTYDVVVCDGCTAVPAGHQEAGMLWLPPAPVARREAAPLLALVDAHPILGMVRLDDVLVAPVESSVLLDGATVIASAAGLPVIAASEDRRRMVRLLVDPAQAAFAMDPAFPLLVANALDWLAAPRRETPVLDAGEVLRWTQDAGGEPPVATGPDGMALPVSVHEGVAVTTATTVAGVYRVGTARAQRAIVVNPDTASESGGTNQSRIGDGAPDGTPAAGWATDITSLFFAAALGLAAIEWRHRHGAGRR